MGVLVLMETLKFESLLVSNGLIQWLDWFSTSESVCYCAGGAQVSVLESGII